MRNLLKGIGLGSSLVAVIAVVFVAAGLALASIGSSVSFRNVDSSGTTTTTAAPTSTTSSSTSSTTAATTTTVASAGGSTSVAPAVVHSSQTPIPEGLDCSSGECPNSAVNSGTDDPEHCASNAEGTRPDGQGSCNSGGRDGGGE